MKSDLTCPVEIVSVQVEQKEGQEKAQIAEELYKTFHLNEAMIRRCLVFPK